MERNRLGEVETRFANIVWENEPISSGELVKMCASQLDWKKSTTYTVLKKFCNRGIFQNVQGTVSALVTREDYYAMSSESFVDETFQGSLPAFIAAFTKRTKLSEEEIKEILQIIEANGR